MNKHQLLENWSPVIEQTIGTGVDKSKKELVATICQLQENYEARLGGGLNENNFFAQPGSVNGMGAVSLPDVATGAQGSGDVPYSLLPLAIQVAAQTIGLELVPTIPMNSPVGMLSYMDFVYGGGKNGYAAIADPYAVGTAGVTPNSPIYIKVKTTATTSNVDGATFNIAAGGNGAAEANLFTVLGKSRIDGYTIIKVPATFATPTNSIALIIPSDTATGGKKIIAANPGTVGIAGTFDIISKAELVKGLEDHIVDFSTNQGVSEFGGVEKMTRQQGEAIQSNTGNLQLFSKAIEAKTVQAAAAVTREQLMDLKQFGIDAVAQANQFLANEMTQVINKDILSNIFKLGKTNHANIEAVSGKNYHLILDDATTAYSTVPGTAAGQLLTGSWTYFGNALTVTPVDASNLGAENLGTRQRRLMSRMLASSNIISVRGRRGPATFAVCSGNAASGFQDCAGFVPYPIANTINQVPGALYPLGTLAGIAIYVDPNMAWEDVRIALGRKGDGNTPGLVFMPYVMADTVETIAEGTMAPKMQMKSRYAIVEAGHHPETMYLTFGAEDKVDGGWA